MVRFSENKNLNDAMEQLIEWKILEYSESSNSYLVTKAFKESIKKVYDEFEAYPEGAEYKSAYDFFTFLIEQYVGVGALVGKDRLAILAIFASLVEELDLKTPDKRYEN